MLPRVEFKNKEVINKKTQLEKFFNSMTGEMISEAMESYVLSNKQDFLHWLDNMQLDYLFDMKREKTLFEWKVAVELMNVLMRFDGLVEQHDKQFGKPIDAINKRLNETMSIFSDDYGASTAVDKVYADGDGLNYLELNRLTLEY